MWENRFYIYCTPDDEAVRPAMCGGLWCLLHYCNPNTIVYLLAQIILVVIDYVMLTNEMHFSN